MHPISNSTIQVLSFDILPQKFRYWIVFVKKIGHEFARSCVLNVWTWAELCISQNGGHLWKIIMWFFSQIIMIPYEISMPCDNKIIKWLKFSACFLSEITV